MSKIYLVRHGQTDDNIQNKMQGWKDTPLNDFGRSQARKLIDFFKDESIQVIYASDLSRAYETARIIAEPLELNVFLDKQLREMYLGSWEGRSWQEIEAEFAYFFGKPENEKNALSIHEGESYIEFQKRCHKSFERLTQRHETFDMIIVTHSGYIREVIAYILKLNQQQKDAIPILNCSVSVIEYEKELNQYRILDLCLI
jgi:broad specificity phosphatase PhoE